MNMRSRCCGTQERALMILAVYGVAEIDFERSVDYSVRPPAIMVEQILDVLEKEE